MDTDNSNNFGEIYFTYRIDVTIVKIYVTKIKSAAINVDQHSLPTEYSIKLVSLFG